METLRGEGGAVINNVRLCKEKLEVSKVDEILMLKVVSNHFKSLLLLMTIKT